MSTIRTDTVASATAPSATTSASANSRPVRARRAIGVLPDSVVKDHRAEAAFVFVTLADGLDADTLRAWLSTAGQLQDTLNRATTRPGSRGTRVATCTIGLGRRLLNRVGDEGRVPVGLRTPPSTPVAPDDVDVVFYVMTTSEAALADFLKGVAATRPTLTAVSIERGFQRADAREVFGHLDGLRNMPGRARPAGAFIRAEDHPDEPDWVDGGSYLAYLKISQDVTAAAAVDQAAHEQIMGRRLSDGSRLDLPAGTDPHTETEFADAATPPLASHVRKTGPRGPVHDQVAMLRRGVPYLTLGGDGSIDAGLQFASFLGDLDVFDVILNDWMLNPDFPTPGAGQDALVARGLVQFRRAGFYLVPPDDSRFPGAGLFDPPRQPGRPRSRTGRLHIRKRFADAAGNRVRRERSGVTFTLYDQTGAVVGEPFTTNSAGRAVSAPVPLNTPLVLRETLVPAGITPASDQQVVLQRRHQGLTVVNTVITPGAYSG